MKNILLAFMFVAFIWSFTYVVAHVWYTAKKDIEDDKYPKE